MAESYYELLKRPEWQKKRLRIMERDDFACRECGDKGTTLNVHHSYYTKDAKPWEYPDESLRTLCRPCHELLHGKLQQARVLLGCIHSGSLDQAIGYLTGLYLHKRALKGDFETVMPLDGSTEEGLYSQAMGLAHANFDFQTGDSPLTPEDVVIYTDGEYGISQECIRTFYRESAEAAAHSRAKTQPVAPESISVSPANNEWQNCSVRA